MTYPHRQRANGFPLCECGAMPGSGPTSTWGADCPVAMRAEIDKLEADLALERKRIAATVTAVEIAEKRGLRDDETPDEWAERIVRERDTTRRTLSALDCRYTGGGVADVSGSHCPMGAPCERCQRDARIEELEADLVAWKCAAPGGRRPCPDCKGTGDGPSGVPWCPRCDGEGYVELCEGCDADATTHDSEGVPLCAACYDALPLLADEVSDADRESAARVDDVEGDL